MESILSKFLQTKIYKQLIADPELIMVYIAGSRLLGYAEEKSDYDIGLLYKTKTPNELLDSLGVKWDRIIFHWDRWTVEEFITDKNAAVSAAVLDKFQANNILYINPQHKQYLDKIFQHKNDVMALAQHKVFEANKDLLETLITQPELSNRDLKKSIYRLLVLAYNYLGQEESFDLCWKTKRAVSKAVSLKDRQQIQAVLRDFVQTIKNDSYDSNLEQKRILDMLKQ